MQHMELVCSYEAKLSRKNGNSTPFFAAHFIENLTADKIKTLPGKRPPDALENRSDFCYAASLRSGISKKFRWLSHVAKREGRIRISRLRFTERELSL
jgi:hypothetical protein